jgi:diguanylate cyclase (GGDEF)-like protein/PAS domain S-box-containing protein
MSNILGGFEDLLNDLFEGVYFVDKDRGITFWNRGAERITGFSASEMLGRFCYDNMLNHIDETGKQLCFDGCPLHATLQDGNQRNAQVYLHHKLGHRVRVDIRVRPLYINGEIVGAAEVFSNAEIGDCVDIGINEMERLALYDQLTQLPNRRYIDNYLGNQIRDYQTLGIDFGVLMLDLDLFKDVNDTYGHSVGDLVLKMVADTFQSSIRKNDFFGRWGGEEFVAILRGVNQKELRMIAEKVRKLVEQSGLKHEDDYVRVTISIGATMMMPQDNANSLIKRADHALYTSKREGRNRVTVL